MRLSYIAKGLGLLLCLLPLFQACTRRGSEKQTESGKRVQAESRRLTAVVTTFGSVQSASSSVIRAPSGGRVDAIRVDRGAYIKPGDVLLEVVNGRHVRQRDEKTGEVTSCEWKLRKKELERDSKQGVEREIAAADVEIARADLEIARRKLETAVEDMNNCTVRAPFAGTVMSVDVKVGDLVSGSSEYSLGSPLFQVVGSNDYIVEVSLGEVETSRVDTDCRVEVRLPALFGEVFAARIKSISQAGRRSDRGPVFPVVVTFSSDDPRVKLGLSADVRFILSTRDATTALPLSAVHVDENGAWVTVDGQGKPERRQVKLGVNDAAFVEVVSGVKESEWVLD